VTGRNYDLPLDSVVSAVDAVLKRHSWQRAEPLSVIDGQSEVTIAAVAKSFILDLPADVAVRVADDGETTLVDMRSASRYGRYDLGDNASRIVAFMAELDREVAGELAGQAGPAPAE
jgi:uncharacterized protein (DUF1499 family)